MRKTYMMAFSLAILTVAVAVLFAGPDYTPQSRQGGYTHRTISGAGAAVVVTSDVGSVELLRAGITTATVQNASSEGQYLLIVNRAPTNVMFADSGNLELSGATTLGEFDTLLLYAIQATQWVEIAQTDN